MNVTVCNFTRFGDLLQSQAVLDDLRVAGHTVDLVCLENFASAVAFLRNVNKTWPFPGGKILALTETSWPEAAARLTAFANEIVNVAKPDCVLNLTPGAGPRLFTRLLLEKHPRVLGFGMDRLGFGVDHGVWTSFFSVGARKRINSPFNLADMMRMLAMPVSGVLRGDFRLRQPDAGSVAWAQNFLSAAGSGAVGHMAFQLGASEERRRWPVESFCQLGAELWRSLGIMPVLLGSKGEKNLAEAYAVKAAHPFIDAVGVTDIPQLAGLLTRMRLLVTNDTGTMHLASGLGIPSLAFFLAAAQPWDTGPMLPGCCCLEPALPCHPCAFNAQCDSEFDCRKQISPRTAMQLVKGWLAEGKWDATGIEDARVWLTARDEHDFYQIMPLNEACEKGPGLWSGWMRIFWRQLFDDMGKIPQKQAGQAFAALTESYGSRRSPGNADVIAQSLAEGGALLDAIGGCGEALAAKPQLAGIFSRYCEKLHSYWNAVPQLNALAAFWQEFRKNQGGNMAHFARQCRLVAIHVKALAAALEAK